jgi:hypothetical protein
VTSIVRDHPDEERLITMKRIALATWTLLALLALVPQPSPADNATIPTSLWEARDTLLKERDVLLSDRDNLNAQLNKLYSIRKQVDNSLTGNSLNRPALLDARQRLLTQIAKFQGYLDHTERDLLDNDKDLNIVESEIKHYACMNL